MNERIDWGFIAQRADRLIEMRIKAKERTAKFIALCAVLLVAWFTILLMVIL